MAPEYGATCGFFPVDNETLLHLRRPGTDEDLPRWSRPMPRKTDSRGGPGRSIPRRCISTWRRSFRRFPARSGAGPAAGLSAKSFYKVADLPRRGCVGNGRTWRPRAATLTVHRWHKAAAVRAIPTRSRPGPGDRLLTSAATSNPYVLIGAGLYLALQGPLLDDPQPWVKTSLAPGSQVVSRSSMPARPPGDLQPRPCRLRLLPASKSARPAQLPGDRRPISRRSIAVSVLSGNRSFEGRISPTCANYLASPPLVVAYAIAGDMNIDDLRADQHVKGGKPGLPRKGHLLQQRDRRAVPRGRLRGRSYEEHHAVSSRATPWQSVKTTDETYDWPSTSTYSRAAYFAASPGQGHDPPISGARVLALLGDTDHIDYGGIVQADDAGRQVPDDRPASARDFNSYGSRRGNYKVVMRHASAIRIKNEMLDGGHRRRLRPGRPGEPRSSTRRWPIEDAERPLVSSRCRGQRQVVSR